MSNEYLIKSIIPAPVPMQAVYFDPDNDDGEELIRRDVICLAVVHIYPEPKKDEPKRNLGIVGEGSAWNITTFAPVPDSLVRPMVGCKDGDIMDAEWLDGFLGVEYGKQEDWDEEIRELRGDGPDCDCPGCQKKKMVN